MRLILARILVALTGVMIVAIALVFALMQNS